MVSFLIAPAFGDISADSFHLNVSIVLGEHSRDSNSTTIILTVSGDKMIYQQSYQGAHVGSRAPVKKQYRLTNDQKRQLLALLNEKNLWVAKTISQPPEQKGISRYFELRVRADLKGKQSSISIDGSRTDAALREVTVYKNAISLIDALYGVIKETDPDMQTPRLIELN
jgi:hypothetical protein